MGDPATRADAAPPRVLHVLSRSDRGGIESWLVRLVRAVGRRAAFTISVNSPDPGACEPDLTAAGASVVRIPRGPGPWPLRFYRFLRDEGPFDVVHSHVHFYSGLVLTAARVAGVPVRIAHSHTDVSPSDLTAPHRAYATVMRSVIGATATHGLACSTTAAAALFSAAARGSGRARVHRCGLDLGPFERTYDRAAVRESLGVAPDEILLAHVGRFGPEKNQTFLIDVLAEARAVNPRARLLLLGDGPCRAAVLGRAAARGARDAVIAPGVAPDVATYLSGAADVFLLPSLQEGLGLAAVEAQAAGLRCVASTAVPAEAEVVPGSVRFLDLGAGASAWARAALDAAVSRLPRPPGANPLRGGPFDVEAEAREMVALYRGGRPIAGGGTGP